MRRLWIFMTVALAVAGTFAITPAAYTAQINRDLLWATVKVCVLNMRALGSPAPCTSVVAGDAGQPGYAILHVPGAATHLVVTPADDVAGLESPQLQGSDGAALARAALAARAEVVRAAAGRVSLGEVGIAVNSPAGRSQDQLHIHVDCVRNSARAALAAAAPLGPHWTKLTGTSMRGRYLAKSVPADESFNPFRELALLVNDPRRLEQASLAVLPTASGYALVADLGPRAVAEELLDHRCAVAANTASGASRR